MVSGVTYMRPICPIPRWGCEVDALGRKQEAKEAKSGGKAVLVKGSTFAAKLQVMAPAPRPPPGPGPPTPDAMTEYSGTGMFITPNVQVKGTRAPRRAHQGATGLSDCRREGKGFVHLPSLLSLAGVGGRSPAAGSGIPAGERPCTDTRAPGAFSIPDPLLRPGADPARPGDPVMDRSAVNLRESRGDLTSPRGDRTWRRRCSTALHAAGDAGGAGGPGVRSGSPSSSASPTHAAPGRSATSTSIPGRRPARRRGGGRLLRPPREAR